MSGRPIGQHWTFGQAIVVPIGQSGNVPGGLGGLAAGLICLALLLLAIASTIVLALIPVYLKTRDVNAVCTSDPIAPVFNIDGGNVASGQLSSVNQGALQNSLNTWLQGQSGFRRCTIRLRSGNVDSCPSFRELLQRTRKRRAEMPLLRSARRTNENCVSQQITTNLVLDCGCRCVGVCLRRRLAALALLLRTISITVTFPDGTSITVRIVGIDVFIRPQTSSTTASTRTSTRTSTATTPNIVG